MKKPADSLHPNIRYYVNEGCLTEKTAMALQPTLAHKLKSDALLDLFKAKKLTYVQILALEFDEEYNLNYFPEIKARLQNGELPLELVHCPGAQFYIENNCLTLEQFRTMDRYVKNKLNSAILQQLFSAGKLKFEELLSIDARLLATDEETFKQFSNGKLPLEFLVLGCPGLQFYIDRHCVTLETYKNAAAAVNLANAGNHTYIDITGNLNSKILQKLFLERKLSFDQILSLDTTQRDRIELKEKVRMRFEDGESCFEPYFIYPVEINYMQYAIPLSARGHYHTLTKEQQQTLDSEFVRKCFEHGFFTVDEIFNYALNNPSSKIELSYKDFKSLKLSDESPLLHRKIKEAMRMRSVAKILFFPTPRGQIQTWLSRIPENVKITIASLSTNPELCDLKTAERIALRIASKR